MGRRTEGASNVMWRCCQRQIWNFCENSIEAIPLYNVWKHIVTLLHCNCFICTMMVIIRCPLWRYLWRLNEILNVLCLVPQLAHDDQRILAIIDTKNNFSKNNNLSSSFSLRRRDATPLSRRIPNRPSRFAYCLSWIQSQTECSSSLIILTLVDFRAPWGQMSCA